LTTKDAKFYARKAETKMPVCVLEKNKGVGLIA
jgi:hypothetical protein